MKLGDPVHVGTEHSLGGNGSDNEDADLVGGGGGGGGTKKEEISRSKRSLEKYIEDEQLGDMATQAIPLFGNINYPNLRNEMGGENRFEANLIFHEII